MSMIGIGLGGFMDGYQKMAESQRQDKRAKALDEQLKLDQKRAARQDTLDTRADAEWQRGEDQRASIEGIGKQAKVEFDKAVAAGTEDPKRFDEFYRSYAVPQIQNTYLAGGDIEKAQRFMTWADTADAKAGGRYAMSAMFKANNGNLQGALDDALNAGKLTGYVDHGFELLGHEQIVDKTGAAVGFRVKVKDPDGNEVVQDITNADLPRMVSTWLNPQAAFESREATKAAGNKRQTELQDYEEKKKIDKKYEGGGKTRGAAIAALRKRMDGGLAGDEQKFDDLSRDEQEKLISAETELQSGDSAPAAEQPGLGNAASTPRNVTVDTVTGKPVNAPVQPAAPQQQAPAKDGAAAIDQQTTDKKSREENIRYMIEYANKALAEKQDPLRIAEELQTQGVPRELWPEAVSAAVEQMQSKQIGLGR